MTDDTIIRELSADETAELVSWAKDEGWNPGPADAAAFYAADPKGFLGCFVGDQLVAGISTVIYGQEFGFIGLYICRPDYRGNGYGLKVWNAGMARLGGVTSGLDGVPGQQANYAAMGFERAYETARWSGFCKGQFAAPLEAKPLSPADLAAVSAFDRRFFPGPRDAFLKAWLFSPRHAFGVIRDGVLKGYTVVRACMEGYKLGPLFADDQDVAQSLLAAAVNACDGEELHIDVPAYQKNFSRLLEAGGFTRGFETARMYKGGAPEIESQGVFAITTLELG